MKTICITCLLAAFSCVASQPPEALFGYFSYKGNDRRFEQQFSPDSQYLNPVLAGFYPDPSVCRKGDTYYLVTSSFAYYPGVPVFTSKDLVNWRQIGHALTRDSQLQLHHHGVSDGIFAPSIAFNAANGTFYMVTMNMGERQVFYVKSKEPEKGWSEPVQLRGGGMDPSFFFDKDRQSYLVYTTLPVGGQNYDGEMAIHALPFSVAGDSVFGKPVELVRGGFNPADKPVWIEGPHLYHIGEWYYLMCAQGGTGENHSEVIFRSRQPLGPYESYDGNPILTQSGLAEREDAVSSVGHAALIETLEGDWWAVFLGCRPYEGDFYNTGRETFLLPVKWKDGWPLILNSSEPLPAVGRKRNLQPAENQLTGNFACIDKFDRKTLDMRWLFLRNPAPGFYSFDNNNGIRIKALPTNLRQKEALSAIFCRQQHTTFEAETELVFNPLTDSDFAGMTVFQNEDFNFAFGKTLLRGKPAIVLTRTEKETVVIGSIILSENEASQPIKLKVSGNGRYYSFACQTGSGEPWRTIAQGADAANLSTARAGGFTGAMLGLYATSNY